MKKINVVVLFGGKSAEHEVSLRSAKNIIEAMDKTKYNPILVGIDKEGKWLSQKNSIKMLGENHNVMIGDKQKGEIVNFYNPETKERIDVVFPILHGPFGEDGTVQGLLKLLGVPFVGSGVLGSAVGMDKDVMKRLLKEAGVPIGKFLVFKADEKISFKKVVDTLGLPFFIKPANLGSSVGVHKVKSKKDFERALEDAFKYDRKILAEEFIEGREIECSVLGNEKPIASVPGEVTATHEFYSYEAKYLDEKGAVLQIPAKISGVIKKKIQKLAIQTFNVLCCEGFGRVDFFLKKNGDVLVNEINTIPGFTSISMYPKLWEASGIKYSDLIDKLITLAIEKHGKEAVLKNSR